MRPWELICTPMRGSFGYEMVYLTTPSLVIYYERYDACLRLRGTGPPKMLAFAVPVCAKPDTTYWKAPQAATGFPCMLPGALDVLFAKGHRQIIVLVELPLLRSHLAPEAVSRLEAAASVHLLPAAADDVTALGAWLLRMLREVRTRPRVLYYAEAIRSLEADLVHRLANAFYPHACDLAGTKDPRRITGLNRALDYLRGRQPGEVTVSALCEVAALSQRSLERAFQDRFDLTARDYLSLRRYNAVRRSLMAARKGEGSVAEIAYEHGFYELGRFAGNYSRMFGERPSQTLAREFPPMRNLLFRSEQGCRVADRSRWLIGKP